MAVPTNYGIQNGSNFPIKVTGLSAEAASGFRLMDPSSFVDGADRTYLVNKNQMSHGQATLRLADQQITTASAGGSWMAGADFTGLGDRGRGVRGGVGLLPDRDRELHRQGRGQHDREAARPGDLYGGHFARERELRR